MGVMSLSSPSPLPSWPDEPPPLVCWRSWPASESLTRSGLVLAGLLAAGLGVRWVTGHAHLALLAVAALALSLWRFLLPVVFTLSADGSTSRCWAESAASPGWAIRRYEVSPNGVMLFPYADATWVDSFQGFFLPWGNHRQEILTLLNYYLGVRS